MKHFLSLIKQISLSVLTILLLVFFAISAYSICVPNEAAGESAGSRPPSINPKEDTDKAETESDGITANASAPTRKNGVRNFLICGKDRASGLCDVIVIAEIDSVHHTASIVQIPRDTYASYSDGGYHKLNGAPAALGGMAGMSLFLSEALGIPIDHYALVDLDCVGDIVNAIGGVKLNVPIDMDYEDVSQGLSIHLKAGEQTLNGDLAEQFLRFRSGYKTADLGRLDAQKRFVSALLSSVKKNCTLPALIRIVRSLYGRVEADLSIGECIRLAATGLRLSPDRLSMETIPGEAVRENGDSGTSYYILSRNGAYDTVNRMLNPFDAPLCQAAFDPKERFTSNEHPHIDRIYRNNQSSPNP